MGKTKSKNIKRMKRMKMADRRRRRQYRKYKAKQSFSGSLYAFLIFDVIIAIAVILLWYFMI
jgi:hypothetical protein